MNLKQFKTKFKRCRFNIEQELDKIKELCEELDNVEVAEIVNEIVDNVIITIIDRTYDTPTDVNLATYEDFLEDEVEEINEDTEE